MKDRIFVVLLCLLFSLTTYSQVGSIRGSITENGRPLAFATIGIESLEMGSYSDNSGAFEFKNIPLDTYLLKVSFVGYESLDTLITINNEKPDRLIDIKLTPIFLEFDEVVVTGTKTFKRRTRSAVIVNVVDSKLLNEVQACNLSEGLKFQPGLRVETDCQTCNYTQLRMNGLAGGYSQILVNGRPVFSPLTGLYGMEQLPSNMIERIEVVRGGGSSLYGSSAIGGTVNVITRIPKENTISVSNTFQLINQQSSDNNFDINSTLVNQSKKLGLAFYGNHRQRDFYDHNGDNYSELPQLKNLSFGTSGFYMPSENQKLEFSFSRLNEYRLGGEMVSIPVHEMGQAEERNHKVWMTSVDYQINLNDEQTTLITYAAGQRTLRDHYTGIFPDDLEDIETHQANPPYGNSETTTLQTGFQVNHSVNQFLKGKNIFTLGGEIVYDDTKDFIPAYRYLIDQETTDIGVFAQSDWEILPSINLLSGLRMDKHNLVEGLVYSPRISALFHMNRNMQMRMSFGTGFRAPQAFDADLHIAFAGGGVSRVILSPDLAPEYSKSFSASINYDLPAENYIAGFTFEGFSTQLNDAFTLMPIGSDAFGEVFEKQNGDFAKVRGITLELRANFNRKAQIESGFTFQSSEYGSPVEYIEGLGAIKKFIRTPNQYGFTTLTLTPNSHWQANLNYVYTGTMIVPHFAGALNQEVDEYFQSPEFHDLSAKLSYRLSLERMSSDLELYGGVKNVLNAYQGHFDIGKNRDSNFVFGPSMPRSVYAGIRISL